jgi:hypothetical protein
LADLAVPRYMSGVLALDRGPLPRVAWLVLAGCAPTMKVPAEPPEPAPGVVNKLSPAPTGHEVVVGELCPQGAAGRPAVAPLLVRNVGWSDNATDLGAILERGSVPRFAVYGIDGKLAGAFDTMGTVDIGLPQEIATGAYAGAPPCTYGLTAKAKNDPGTIQTRAEDPKCMAATNGCGLAIGPLTHGEQLPDVPNYVTGGACVSGDQLAVDIDGDGRVESFPLAGVLDSIRGPASEWVASPTATASCTPSFQIYDIKLAAPAGPKRPADPRATVTMDVLGVVDLDGDGRRELVLALRFPTTRSIVVYTASETAQRLDLAGEATAFPKQ